MAAYAPGLDPVEGVWSLLKRAICDFGAADIRSLVRIVQRDFKKIQFRPDLLNCCPTETGLVIQLPTSTSSTEYPNAPHNQGT
ncbi:MAG: hypothetical protein HOY79_23990 [Streptomyces sp.]|nr:hypothetical protein [Streptomyces sp.]